MFGFQVQIIQSQITSRYIQPEAGFYPILLPTLDMFLGDFWVLLIPNL